jgi:hypothetical protein
MQFPHPPLLCHSERPAGAKNLHYWRGDSSLQPSLGKGQGPKKICTKTILPCTPSVSRFTLYVLGVSVAVGSGVGDSGGVVAFGDFLVGFTLEALVGLAVGASKVGVSVGGATVGAGVGSSGVGVAVKVGVAVAGSGVGVSVAVGVAVAVEVSVGVGVGVGGLSIKIRTRDSNPPPD